MSAPLYRGMTPHDALALALTALRTAQRGLEAASVHVDAHCEPDGAALCCDVADQLQATADFIANAIGGG